MGAASNTWRDRGYAVLARLRQWGARPSLRIAFLALSLAFLAIVLRTHWADIKGLTVQMRWTWVGASAVLLLPSFLVEVWLWRALLRQIGWSLPLRQASGVWFLSNLARYIPGNVWQFLGMMELGADRGIPRAAMLTSVVLHQVYSNLTGLLVGLPALAAATGLRREVLWAVAAGVAVALAAALSPWAIARASKALTTITRPATGEVRLDARTLFALLLGYCLYWALVGLAFALLGHGIGANWDPILGWASAFPASYVAGYLSLLTPSGVGVREGVLALLLAPIAGPGLAAVVALVARLWLTLAELLAASIALAVNRSLFRSAGREEQP